MQYNIKLQEIIFETIKDYSLDETFLCGQTFRWDPYKEGYRGFAGPYLCYVYFQQDNLHIRLLQPTEDMQKAALYLIKYLALDIDYSALKQQFSQDETMAKAISYAQGIRVLNQEFFETLLTFIISQNNNIPRIKKIVDTLAKEFGTCMGEVYAFPTPQQLAHVSEEEYRRLKLGFRAKYVYDAVQKILDGTVSQEKLINLPYPQAQKYLMQIKGVGPKVADCVLLFSAQKYESFPKDVWIIRALEQLFPNGLPACIKGYEGIAQQYIFHYARFHLEK